MPELNNMSRRELSEMIQLNHPEKILGLYPGMNEKTAADVFGISLSLYRSVKKSFSDAAEKAARKLLSDKKFHQLVEELPFRKGDTIAAVGDSITDDYQSWFEILRNLLGIVHGKDSFHLMNAGYSGETTSQMVTRFIEVALSKPAWIFFLAGTNDARRHGLNPKKTVVSISETKKNYAMLREFALAQTKAKLVWITPPRILADKIARVPILRQFQFSWKAEDIEKVADVALSQKEFVVNLRQDVYTENFNQKLLLPDGLHPSLEGHMEIVKKVLKTIIINTD